jgi:hypothetical protein
MSQPGDIQPENAKVGKRLEGLSEQLEVGAVDVDLVKNQLQELEVGESPEAPKDAGFGFLVEG